MSNLNKVALAKILESPFGVGLVETLYRLEEEMKLNGASDIFVQLGFIQPGQQTSEGDLIPTIHISLRPNDPILSQPLELIWNDNDDDGTSVQSPNGPDGE